MLRNFQKYGDDEKQLISLKEQLQLAIKNDEAISGMRAMSQKNIPIEPSREDSRTLAEQIADEDSQRVQAQEKLSQLFKGPEVLTILGLLNKDQIVAINTLFNGIKDELKGVNTKLMLPKDFILFLNKYIDDAVSLQGALTVGLNSINELQQIIPNKSTMNKLDTFLSTRSKTNTLLSQVKELSQVLPNTEDYMVINNSPAMQQKKLIDQGATLYPNNILLLKAIDEGNVGKIEKLLQSITPNNISKIGIYLAEIDNERAKQRSAKPTPPPIPPFPARFVGKPQKLGTPIKLTQAKSARFTFPPQSTKRDTEIIRQFEEEMGKRNKEYLDNLKPTDRNAIVKYLDDDSNLLTQTQRFKLGEFMMKNGRDVAIVIQLFPLDTQDVIINALERYNPDPNVDSYQFVGKGIKMGRGRPPTDKPKTPTKMKIGEGIKVERKPVNIEFGKYVLNTNQLKKQVLHLKGRAGGALSWFRPTPMSDQFTELITDMIESGSVNKHLLKSLDKEEQNTFYEVCDKAGLLGAFKLTKPENTEEKDLMNKFQILLGEFKAGNNSPLLFQQLRKHIIYFTEKGRIPKQKALSMLTELS